MSKKVLVMVDLQNDFITGTLKVSGAEKVIKFANSIADNYDVIVATLDWHPDDHMVFLENNKGEPLNVYAGGIEQCTWPKHCVQNTYGAELHSDLKMNIDMRIFKGIRKEFHPFGAFFDYKRNTELMDFLSENGVTPDGENEFDLIGLATDYCVLVTVLQGQKLGFKISVLMPGCAEIELHEGDTQKAIDEMRAAGALIVE